MKFVKGGKWLVGAVVLACLVSTPILAVEGGGAYRGAGLIIPHFQNTPNIQTFVRFGNNVNENNFEATWTGDGIVAPLPHPPVDINQQTVCFHITYLQPVDVNGTPVHSFGHMAETVNWQGQNIQNLNLSGAGVPFLPESWINRCQESDDVFCLTDKDYKLLRVRSGTDPDGADAPPHMIEGYIVGWATRMGPGGSPTFSKILHNHFFADEVTVNITDGQAWGTNAITFRATGEAAFIAPHQDKAPRAAGTQFGLPDGVNPDWWYWYSGDAQRYAILGNGVFPETASGGNPMAGIAQYENLRFGEQFYGAAMSERVNLLGATSRWGSRYIVVAMSWLEQTDLNNDGDELDSFEAVNRTVLVPERLSAFASYANRYHFVNTLWNHDEQLASADEHDLVCYRRYTLREITNNTSNSISAFQGPASIEQWQGTIRINGVGLGTMLGLQSLNAWDYWNRAIIVQVDNIRYGRNVQWGFYMAHDRTTAEIDPDPKFFTANGDIWADNDGNAYNPFAVEPDSAPQYNVGD